MAQQQSPWLEGAYGWSFGEGGWNTGMDQNLLKFSFMFDRNVDSVVASLPAAVNGQAHYLTTDNRLYFVVGTTYFSTPVPKWFEFKDRVTGTTYQFNGTAAVQVDSPAELDSRLDAVELTVASLGTAAFEDIGFFATQVELDIVEAAAQAYTDDLRQDLSDTIDPAKGAGLVGFDESLLYTSGTIGNTLKSLIDSDYVTVVQAIGDGVTDDAPTINAALALGGYVFLPKPSVEYLIQSQLVFPVQGTVLFGEGMYASVIKKGFNGEAITVTGVGSKVARIAILGEGATFTGGGIKPIGYNVVLEECRIIDTQDSPVLFDAAVSSNALAGTYAEVNSCFLLPTNLATPYAIRSTGSDNSIHPTVRTFRNISGGGPLVDFSGMNRAILTDSFGTILKFSATSGKITMSKNRMTNGAININVLGNDHDLEDNIWSFSAGGSVSIDATCLNVHWGPQNQVVINSATMQSPTIGHAIAGPMPNNVYTNLKDYTASFTWLGTSSNGVFGNSTVSAFYKLSGRHCYVSFFLLRGSTATNPVGTWSVQLPFKAFVTSVHPILVKSSTGTYQTALLEVQGGASTAVIYLNATTAAVTEASISFGTGGILEGTLNYLVSIT